MANIFAPRATGFRARSALAKDFEGYGEGVIRIARIEKPVEYLRLIASIMPKEFIVSESELDVMNDDELAGGVEHRAAGKGSKDGPAAMITESSSDWPIKRADVPRRAMLGGGGLARLCPQRTKTWREVTNSRRDIATVLA